MKIIVAIFTIIGYDYSKLAVPALCTELWLIRIVTGSPQVCPCVPFNRLSPDQLTQFAQVEYVWVSRYYLQAASGATIFRCNCRINPGL